MEAHIMTIQRPVTPSTDHPEIAALPSSMITSAAARALGALRIATGFLFLWAFLDKAFGLYYSTPPAKAWLHGGSPTKGFLKSVEVGPFQSMFRAIAGTWWADGLFMLGLLGIGVALIAGVAVRIAAVSGVVMVAGDLPPRTVGQHRHGDRLHQSVHRRARDGSARPDRARADLCGYDLGARPDLGPPALRERSPLGTVTPRPGRYRHRPGHDERFHPNTMNGGRRRPMPAIAAVAGGHSALSPL
jgi:hypothetical protein